MYNWTEAPKGHEPRDIPVIFSGPMVQSLLADRKMMTRRLLYSSRRLRDGSTAMPNATFMDGIPQPKNEFPMTRYFTLSGWERVRPGDRLWVRENIRFFSTGHDCEITYFDDRNFQAGPLTGDIPDSSLAPYFKTANKASRAKNHVISIPSIHMPRWVSRLTLLVTEVKIEPLIDISDQDCVAEGIELDGGFWKRYAPEPCRPDDPMDVEMLRRGITDCPRVSFLSLWASLHGYNGGYGAVRFNPHVVAIRFNVIKANIDSAEARAA